MLNYINKDFKNMHKADIIQYINNNDIDYIKTDIINLLDKNYKIKAIGNIIYNNNNFDNAVNEISTFIKNNSNIKKEVFKNVIDKKLYNFKNFDLIDYYRELYARFYYNGIYISIKLEKLLYLYDNNLLNEVYMHLLETVDNKSDIIKQFIKELKTTDIIYILKLYYKYVYC